MPIQHLPGAVAALVLSLAAAQASATLINVKVGATATGVTQSGGAVLGSASSWWNNYQYTSSTPSLVSVVDDLNAPVPGVQLTISNSGGVGSFAQATGSPSFLMGTGRWQNGGGVWTVSFAGLAANTHYRFVGYASHINNGINYGGNWSVTTGTAGSGTLTNDGSSVDIATGAGKAYVDFLATTDGTGRLVIRDTYPTGRVPFQGFQLSSVSLVPEPSSVALMLGGALLLWARRAVGGRMKVLR